VSGGGTEPGTIAPARVISRRRQALRENELRAVLLFGDAVAAAVAAVLAPAVWAVFDASFRADRLHEGLVAWQVASVPLWVAAVWLLGGTDVAVTRFFRASVTVVAQALVGVGIAVLVAFYFAPFFAPRGATLLSLPVAAALILAWRGAYARAVATDAFDRRVAVLGTDRIAVTAAEVMLAASGIPYRLVAFIATDPDAPPTVLGVPVVRVTGELWSKVRELDIDQLLVGDLRGLAPSIPNDLVRCFEHGVETLPATAMYEQLTGRVMASALSAEWYAELPTHTRRIYMAVKYLVDLLMSLVLAIVTAPLLLVAAIGILATSGWPIVYRQLRIGQRGEPFIVHKLRTMRPDAEAEGQPVWASEKDPRVGRFGGALRRARIDELPQLWDVVRGKMSLIGPRPERPEFVHELSSALPLYRARLLLRPGLTGWAQVQYPYAGSVASNLEKLEYDLYYLRHLGPVLDLSIALRTVGTILGLRGR